MRYFGPLNAYISNLSNDHNVSHHLKAVTGILMSTGTLAQQLWEAKHGVVFTGAGSGTSGVG